MFCKNGKTFVLESLFNEKLHAKSCRTKTSSKETPTQVFSCKKLAKFFNTYFEERLRTIASNIYPNKAALSILLDGIAASGIIAFLKNLY